MTDELKLVRCGCGGEANILRYEALSGDIYSYVQCSKCGICTKTKPSPSEAVTAWNRVMSGVVTYPCTTPDGVYTSDCTTTNTTDQKEDFHPVRDAMVGGAGQ